MISKLLIILGAITVLNLSGTSTALATTATGSQNPDLTVSVSLASRETADPDVAMVGDTVDAILSVRNNKPWTFGFRAEEVRLRFTLEIPSKDPFSISATIYLLPGTKLTLPFNFEVNHFFPQGTYSLTLEAIEVRDPAAPPSSATATISIF